MTIYSVLRCTAFPDPHLSLSIHMDFRTVYTDILASVIDSPLTRPIAQKGGGPPWHQDAGAKMQALRSEVSSSARGVSEATGIALLLA